MRGERRKKGDLNDGVSIPQIDLLELISLFGVAIVSYCYPLEKKECVLHKKIKKE